MGMGPTSKGLAGDAPRPDRGSLVSRRRHPRRAPANKAMLIQAISLFTLAGQPTGSPTPRTGDFGSSLAFVGDVDGDGRDDFLVSSAGWEGGPVGALWLFSGATRELIYEVKAGGMDQHFAGTIRALGDLDGDGIREWALIRPLSGETEIAGGVVVRSGASGGTLLTLSSRNLGLELCEDIEDAGDLNGDGCPDLLVGGCDVTHARGVSAPIYRRFTFMVSGRNGSVLRRAFAEQEPLAISGTAHALGDIDGDGFGDLLLHDPGQPDRPSWRAVSSNTGGLLYTLRRGGTLLGDLDGDGVPDLVQPYTYGKTGADMIVADSPRGEALQPAGDLDGDGREELLGWSSGSGRGFTDQGSPGTVCVSRLESSPIDFWYARQVWSVKGEPGDEYFGDTTAAGGDLDGDGLPDILIVGSHKPRRKYVRGYVGLTGKVLFTLHAPVTEDE